jgi:type IV pilus assembly protein PilW
MRVSKILFMAIIDITLTCAASKGKGADKNKGKRYEMRRGMSNQGFTLLELMVATTIAFIVMGGIYSTYYSQQKSYLVQTQVAAMQQNLRAAIFHMDRDIRMAGCDPTGAANAGIITATTTSVSFTEDLDMDGSIGANENITYSLKDSNGDGIDDHLDRNNQMIAENIDALNFVYLDREGNPTAVLSDIRSIQVALLARTGRGDPGFTNDTTYYNLEETLIYTAPGDSFRRRLLTTEIKGRNLWF